MKEGYAGASPLAPTSALKQEEVQCAGSSTITYLLRCGLGVSLFVLPPTGDRSRQQLFTRPQPKTVLHDDRDCGRCLSRWLRRLCYVHHLRRRLRVRRLNN